MANPGDNPPLASGNHPGATPSQPVTLSNFTSRFVAVMPQIAAVFLQIIVLAVVGFFMYFIWEVCVNGDHGIVGGIGNIEYARGLITVLFAVGTITVAMSLAFAAIFRSKDDYQKERFEQGREILSVLIGILGAIVGFYFASGNNNSDATHGLPPLISSISPAELVLDKADTLIVTGHFFTINQIALIEKRSVNTEFVNQNELRAIIPAGYFDKAGIYPLYIFDSELGASSIKSNIKVNAP